MKNASSSHNLSNPQRPRPETRDDKTRPPASAVEGGSFVVPGHYDPHMGEFAGREPPGHHTHNVANAQWPRDYKDVPARQPIAVQVRLDFQPTGWIDGMNTEAEWVDGHAVAWTRTHVGVRTNDPRVSWDVVWVAATDVRRV